MSNNLPSSDEETEFDDILDSFENRISEDNLQSTQSSATVWTPQRTVSEDERLTIPPSSGPLRSSPVTAKAEDKEWIADYVADKISYEAQVITKSKMLQTMNQVIDSEVVQDFDFEKIHAILQEPSFAPFSMRLLEAFTTSRHAERHTENRRQRTKMVRA